MSKLTFSFLLVLLRKTAAAPVQSGSCADILVSAGASLDFGSHVGHAIHSLRVADLKKFEPFVTEDNRVPTINLNLSDERALLMYAPDVKGAANDGFLTDGMKVLDLVLSHMDDKSFDIRYFTPLERVVHAFHMQEVYAGILVEYNKIKASPPNEAVCACAVDIENNGVLKMIRFTALAIREPALIYGNKAWLQGEPGKQGYNVQYPVYTYHFNFREASLPQAGQKLSPNAILQNDDQAMPKLSDSKAWEMWKKIGNTGKVEHFDPALFLYCALKAPRH